MVLVIVTSLAAAIVLTIIMVLVVILSLPVISVLAAVPTSVARGNNACLGVIE
jgi:hypothetical protein